MHLIGKSQHRMFVPNTLERLPHKPISYRLTWPGGGQQPTCTTAGASLQAEVWLGRVEMVSRRTTLLEELDSGVIAREQVGMKDPKAIERQLHGVPKEGSKPQGSRLRGLGVWGLTPSKQATRYTSVTRNSRLKRATSTSGQFGCPRGTPFKPCSLRTLCMHSPRTQEGSHSTRAHYGCASPASSSRH